MRSYEGASVTIGGVPVAVESISYSEIATDIADKIVPMLHEVSCTVQMARGAFEELLRALGPIYPPGATPDTLWRRVGYGGRKGRSALRRLRTLGAFRSTP